MSLHTTEDLTSCILDFQANFMRVTHRKKITQVDPMNDDNHVGLLELIWSYSNIEEDLATNGELVRWRKLGFETEDIVNEFYGVGLLGLECLVRLFIRASSFDVVY